MKFPIFTAASAAALIAVLLGAGTFWRIRSEIRAGTFEISAPKIVPDAAAHDGVPVGSVIDIFADAKTHFGLESELDVSFELPDGLEAAGTVGQRASIWGAARETRLHFRLVPFAKGEFSEIPVAVEAREKGSAEKRRVSFTIPAIRATLPETAPDAPIALATEFSDVPANAFSRAWIFAAALGAALLGAGIFLVLRRRKKAKTPPEIPAWTRAENELSALKTELAAGKIDAVAALARLSDIVRRYLTRRFGLSADAMTSQEFFVSMEKPDSPFPPEQRRFLREFLNAADLVKFAGISAAREQTESAIARAGTLVSETAPRPEAATGNSSETPESPRHGKL